MFCAFWDLNIAPTWDVPVLFMVRLLKFCPLIPTGGNYTFQPVAMEVQRSLGGSSENFIKRIYKVLRRSHDDQRAGSFMKPQTSMAL